MNNQIVPIDVNPPNWLRELIIDALRNAGQVVLAEYVRQGQQWAVREAREVIRSLPGRTSNAVRNWLYPRQEPPSPSFPSLASGDTGDSGTLTFDNYSPAYSAERVSPLWLDPSRGEYRRYINSMYRGPFKRPRRRYLNPNEITRRVEKGGEFTAAECAYIGHSYAAEQMLWLCAAAMIAKLFRLAGHRIADVKDVIKGTWTTATTVNFARVILQEKTNVNGVLTATYYNIDNTTTFETLIDQIFLYIRSLTGFDQPTFYCIALQAARNDNVPIEYDHELSKIDLQTEMISVKWSSTLNIQNRTPGDTSTDLSTESVTANPLLGKSYSFKGQGPSLKYMDNGGAANYGALLADKDHGTIAFTSQSAPLTPAQQATLRRPPGMQTFSNCTGTVRQRMDPGSYKIDKIGGKYYMLLNDFFERINAGYIPNNTNFSQFSYAHVFAFDKAVRTGTGTDNPITIGYEINQYYTSVLKKGKLKKANIQQIVY